METNNFTTTFNNLVSDGIPFLVRVDSSDIPIQNLPILVVSHLKQVKSETRGRRKTDFHAGTQSHSKNQEKARSTSTVKKDKSSKGKEQPARVYITPPSTDTSLDYKNLDHKQVHKGRAKQNKQKSQSTTQV